MELNHRLRRAPGQTAVALGCFDGLHRGHTAVIGSAVAGRQRGLIPAVFTFSASPQRELTGKEPPRLLLPDDQRERLADMGVELLYRLDFAPFRELEPEAFVRDVLVDCLRARVVCCGFNYHFGYGGRADSAALAALCDRYHIETVVLPPVEDGGQPVSSTRIRRLVERGEIEDANRLLGRPFGYRLPVVHGRHLGSVMGTPTLNQALPEGFALPKFGVYAALVDFAGTHTYGVTNIGVKPTVGADAPLSETWMPDYHGGELYGETVTVRLLRFLRPEKKFDSIDQLRQAILRNGEQARDIWTAQCGGKA